MQTLTSTLFPIVKRIRIRKLRSIIRGYRQLTESGSLGIIRELKSDLTNSPLKIITQSNVSKLFFGAGIEYAELITRQSLLSRFADIDLNKALLASLVSQQFPVAYPLPRIWQEVLIKHGFTVSQLRCSLAWSSRVLMYWAHGVWEILKHILLSLRSIPQQDSSPKTPFAYFDGLAPGNLPQPCQDGRSHDIITWYTNWNGRVSGVRIIRHDVPGSKNKKVGDIDVEFCQNIIPPLKRVFNILLYFWWSMFAIIRSAFDALQGKWWHAFLLAEASKAAMVRLQEPKNLALDYLFHCSNFTYRPMWTYEAEKKGSKISFYFYTIFEQPKLLQGYVHEKYLMGAMNWPNYLVWDNYQEDLVNRAIGKKANIETVGPIWFQSSGKELPKLPKNSVAVFDVQPHRGHFGFSTLGDVFGDGSATAKQFLLDISIVLHECGGTMVHKRKRDIGNRLNHSYASLVKKLSENENVITLEPEISANRVIENCQLVITMPFTSTSILGRHLGKPSIFYDPLGLVQKDDRAAHGVPIITGLKELREWVFNYLTH